MNTQKLLLLILVLAGVAALLLGRSKSRAASKQDNSEVVHLVEETLRGHQGEASSVVQAFEAALAQEARADA